MASAVGNRFLCTTFCTAYGPVMHRKMIEKLVPFSIILCDESRL